MRKILKLLIPFIILFCINVNAEVTDTTGPVLNNYSFTTTTVYNHKTVNINIDATDDISGAAFVEFDFVDTSKNYTTDINAVLGIQVNIRNGNSSYSSNPINRVEPGNYKLRTVRVYDANMNGTCYVTSTFAGSVNGCTNQINGLDIVLKDDENAIFSELSSFSVSKNNINPGEEITFNVSTTDPTVKYINISYGSKNIQIINNNGATSFTKSTKDFTASGMEYRLNQIELINNDGNHTIYNNDTNTYASGAKMIRSLDLSKYTINVSGTRDTTNPELINVSIPNSKVYAPGILKINVKAKDNIANNIKGIQIDISKKGEKQIALAAGNCKGDDNGFVCTTEISQYFATGTYYIHDIILIDNSDNTTIYYETPIYDYLKLDYIEFEVDTDVKSDVISSTENSDAVNKIKETSDNATITLDSTRNPVVKKEIFDSIKNTNKKLYIESKGIQWIFTGSKITNTTKDINVAVKIYKNESTDINDPLNSINSLVIDFASNGILPGIAKVRIKADYAFRDFIGITNLYVFYYDEENNMLDPIAQKINMTDDGYYEFYIEHNSKYIISNTKPDKKYISKQTNTLKINNNLEDIEELFDTDENTENSLSLDNSSPTNVIANNNQKINFTSIIIIIVIAIIIIGIITFVIIKKDLIKKIIKKIKHK